mmetsp:Transcript_21728/g.60416  ORF Transcript_21728/g.60416 Transcript_21728/m.60416 type:complete len:442 (-) Transcript_21728:88-1413(-)
MGNCCGSTADASNGAKQASGGGGERAGSSAAPSRKATGKAEDKPDVAFGMSKTHNLGRALGSGACGEVWLMTSKASGEKVAVKVMPRPVSKKYEQRVIREIKIHGNVGYSHPNIVSGYEVILTPSHLNLVMEYADGGTMLDYVLNRCKQRHAEGTVAPILDEDEARFFFHQLINAVEHIHKALVAHRDLKLENTLLSHVEVDGESFPILKICDFGFANFFEADAILFTNLGTPPYMSPEVIRGNEGYSGIAADVWSCGVFLYAMLLGTFPFRFQDSGNDTMEFRDLWIQQTKYKWDDQKHTKRLIKFISPEAKDLLDQIFQPDKQLRAAIPKIKSHPWMKKPLSAKYQKCMDRLQSMVGPDSGQSAKEATSAPAPALGAMASITFGGGQVQEDQITKLVNAACSKGAPGETLSIALTGPDSGLTPVNEDLSGGPSRETNQV